MASADYKLCDICGSKAFYDSDLSYHASEAEYEVPYRVAGEEQYVDEEMNKIHGSCLGSVGDWVVLCHECAKTHKTAIIKTNCALPPLLPGMKIVYGTGSMNMLNGKVLASIDRDGWNGWLFTPNADGTEWIYLFSMNE